jgi:hypothetical protein
MKPIEIEQEISESDYVDVLDEIYGEVEICGMKYSSGRALLELDPVAFRCGKVEYEDGLDRKWHCSKCEIEFDDETDAEECCKPEE